MAPFLSVFVAPFSTSLISMYRFSTAIKPISGSLRSEMNAGGKGTYVGVLIMSLAFPVSPSFILIII
jgi:hypothetical protein